MLQNSETDNCLKNGIHLFWTKCRNINKPIFPSYYLEHYLADFTSEELDSLVEEINIENIKWTETKSLAKFIEIWEGGL